MKNQFLSVKAQWIPKEQTGKQNKDSMIWYLEHLNIMMWNICEMATKEKEFQRHIPFV